MRPIKFRAWEKNLRAMISVDSINFEAGLINMELVWRTFEEIELMQYTGLKDKNGTEIFEGDIIEYEGKTNDHGIPWGWEFTTSGKGVVKYDLAGYLVFDLHTDNLVKENLNEFLIQYEEIDVIVIGNIYENPELLKEQNK